MTNFKISYSKLFDFFSFTKKQPNNLSNFLIVTLYKYIYCIHFHYRYSTQVTDLTERILKLAKDKQSGLLFVMDDSLSILNGLLKK